jgi:hypothetical protein
MRTNRAALRLVRGTHSARERQRLHLEQAQARLDDLQRFAHRVLDGPAKGLRNPELREAMEVVVLCTGAVFGDLQACWHEGELARHEHREGDEA